MTDLQKNQLVSAGVDVSDALSRFMGNEALLERFLKKFLQDENFSRLEQAVREGDLESAVAASHTLKGICGNLSLSNLYGLFTRQVELFRTSGLESGSAMMDEISAAYQNAANGIRSAYL